MDSHESKSRGSDGSPLDKTLRSTAGDIGSIPGRGNKILHAVQAWPKVFNKK